MYKDEATELWQLKTGLTGLIDQLSASPDHLSTLTCRVIARALDELLQETESLPQSITRSEIEHFTKAMLAGTSEVQVELAAKWYDELQPLMFRTQERAEQLDHDLAGFTCLSTDGQKWGSVCIKCSRWVFVQPKQASGALFANCIGWETII